MELCDLLNNIKKSKTLFGIIIILGDKINKIFFIKKDIY